MTTTPTHDAPQELLECDLCRRPLVHGDGYYCLTLGLDDTPRFIGLPILAESTVESTSELWFCTRCEPQVSARFEALLQAFWELRAPDPVAPTVPTPAEVVP